MHGCACGICRSGRRGGGGDASRRRQRRKFVRGHAAVRGGPRVCSPGGPPLVFGLQRFRRSFHHRRCRFLQRRHVELVGHLVGARRFLLLHLPERCSADRAQEEQDDRSDDQVLGAGGLRFQGGFGGQLVARDQAGIGGRFFARNLEQTMRAVSTKLDQVGGDVALAKGTGGVTHGFHGYRKRRVAGRGGLGQPGYAGLYTILTIR